MSQPGDHRRALAPIFIAFAWALFAAPALAQSRSWLALGDSYSSGEGIAGTTRDRVASGKVHQGRDCKRATGDGVEATAWAVSAYGSAADDLGLADIDFVACTGAITDEVTSQLEEARARSGRNRWDVVSFSFGGNNIGFADVLTGCLDLNNLPWGHFDLTPGCDISEKRLRERVKMLTGKAAIESGEYTGSLTLPALLDLVVGRVRNGGDVVVAGYPHLVEEVSRWSAWRRRFVGACEGVEAKDVPMLRSVTGYLNQQIAVAVQAADRKYGQRGIRFHFIDISRDPYEFSGEASARHGLCSDDPWLNGLTTGISTGDLRFQRSFHPRQTGHTNTGRVVAEYVRRRVRFDDRFEGLGGPLRADSLGPVELGMTRGEVEAAGFPLDHPEGGFCSSPISNPHKVFFEFGLEDEVTAIGLGEGSRVATEAGLRKGDSVARAKELYGDDLVYVGYGPEEEAGEIGQGTDYVYTPVNSDAVLQFWTFDGEVVGIYATGAEDVPREEFCA